MKKKTKAWAVMPAHGECFSMVFDRSVGLFSNCIFNSKLDATLCKRTYDKKGILGIELMVVQVEILYSIPSKGKKK